MNNLVHRKSGYTGLSRYPNKRAVTIVTRTVQIVVLPGFHMTELAACIDSFLSANDCTGQPLYDVRVVSPAGGEIMSSTGLPVLTEPDARAGETLDYVIVLGCASTAKNSAAVRNIITAKRRFCGGLVVLSSAVDLLTDLRVLKEGEVSAHWNFRQGAQEFATPFNRKLFHKSGSVMTSAGFVGTYDLLLHLIARDHGWNLAGDVSDRLIKGEIRYDDAPQRRQPDQRAHTKHKGLIAAINLIEESLDSPLPISELANAAGYSVRQLERQFRSHYGTSPGRYYLNRRLSRAKAQIEQTTMSVLEIALANGFHTSSHFSRCFTRLFGQSPHRWRNNCLAGKNRDV